MENKTITTKNGRVVVLRQLLTGRDIEYIEQPMLDLKVGFSDKGKIGGEINAGESRRESLHRAIEKVVVSIDAATEGPLELVLNLPAADYKEVIGAVDKIVSGEDF